MGLYKIVCSIHANYSMSRHWLKSCFIKKRQKKRCCWHTNATSVCTHALARAHPRTYARTHMYIHMFMHAFLRTPTHSLTHTHTHTHTHSHTHTHTHTHTHARTHNLFIHVFLTKITCRHLTKSLQYRQWLSKIPKSNKETVWQIVAVLDRYKTNPPKSKRKIQTNIVIVKKVYTRKQ